MKKPRRRRKRIKRTGSFSDYRPEPYERLDNVIVRLPCYEPSGTTIDLTLRDLLRHVILLGQSGSGKTTLMNKMWSDLIAYRTPESGQRVGLLILDSQGDQTVAGVKHLAAKMGRSEDVVVLSPHEGSYNPFGELNSFAAVESAVAKIISATAFSNRSGGDHERDIYWIENTRALIESAFIYLLVEGRTALGVVDSLQFVSELFLATGLSTAIKAVVARCNKIMAGAKHLSAGARAKLVFAQLNLNGWDKLDNRTKSILQSCLRITLAPFLSTSALPYWDANREPLVDPALALHGRIVVISTRAAIEPETAQVLCRLAKMDFYGAAQRRRSSDESQLAGIVSDEFHYSALQGSSRWSDISNLATLRGRGVFVLAATQGLVQLDLLLGPVATEALLINFGSHFFLRSVEIGHLYRLAEGILGNKPGGPPALPMPFATGDLMTAGPSTVLPPEPVCPPGRLAQLDTHQALISLSSGFKTAEPVWLAPLYLPEFVLPGNDPFDADVGALRCAKSVIDIPATTKDPLVLYPVSLWDFLIKTYPRYTKAYGLMTAGEFQTALRSIGREATGIETIPPIWRLACFHLAQRLPLSLRLVHLAAEEGQLKTEFMAWSGGFKLADLIKRQKRWQASVYPSVVRPLRLSERRWLQINYPHVYSQAQPINYLKPK